MGYWTFCNLYDATTPCKVDPLCVCDSEDSKAFMVLWCVVFVLTVMFLFCLAFTMMVAAGPFATSDSIEVEPLHDLLAVVATEEPDVLVLVSL